MEETTRRRVLAGSAATIGGLVAGCAGRASDGSQDSGGGTHTVSMDPVGEVELDGVPKTVATYCPGYADMAVALGHADAVASVGLPSRYHTDGYDELDGVSVDKSSLTKLYQGGVDKEVFLNLGSDLHLIDPNWLLNNFKGWENSDVETVRDRVAPFLGNTIFRRTDDWHGYRYYTMYEAFGKVAEVFQETERYERFAEFHDGFVADVQSRLPPLDDRPAAMLLWQKKNEPETFYPYRLSGQGTNKKQFHDLGVTDALNDTGISGLSTSDRGTVDYEVLLDVDPDAILLRGHEGKSRGEFEDTVLAFMRNHDTASQLRAVQNGAVYRGGPIYQGPIQNLFLTERYAKLLYPEEFSEDRLFDRSTVSGIIAG